MTHDPYLRHIVFPGEWGVTDPNTYRAICGSYVASFDVFPSDATCVELTVAAIAGRCPKCIEHVERVWRAHQLDLQKAASAAKEKT